MMGRINAKCTLLLPTGFTLGSGAGGSYVAPAARDHGAPVAFSASQTLSMAGDTSTCPPDVTARLQAQVELACKTQKSRCTGEQSCAELLARIPVAVACIAAREAIMQQCYGGGDADHIDELNRRKRNLNNCEALYLRKCGPLPQPEPVLRRQPDTEPQPNRPNPAVPIGLTGAALLLYYLLEILEVGLIII